MATHHLNDNVKNRLNATATRTDTQRDTQRDRWTDRDRRRRIERVVGASLNETLQRMSETCNPLLRDKALRSRHWSLKTKLHNFDFLSLADLGGGHNPPPSLRGLNFDLTLGVLKILQPALMWAPTFPGKRLADRPHTFSVVFSVS